MKHFEVKKVNTMDDSEDMVSVVLRDESNTTEVSFKWDGCIDLRRYFNGCTADDKWSKEVEANSDYIHICDINDAIEKLEEIREFMKEYKAEI